MFSLQISIITGKVHVDKIKSNIAQVCSSKPVMLFSFNLNSWFQFVSSLFIWNNTPVLSSMAVTLRKTYFVNWAMVLLAW